MGHPAMRTCSNLYQNLAIFVFMVLGRVQVCIHVVHAEFILSLCTVFVDYTMINRTKALKRSSGNKVIQRNNYSMFSGKNNVY